MTMKFPTESEVYIALHFPKKIKDSPYLKEAEEALAKAGVTFAIGTTDISRDWFFDFSLGGAITILSGYQPKKMDPEVEKALIEKVTWVAINRDDENAIKWLEDRGIDWKPKDRKN